MAKEFTVRLKGQPLKDLEEISGLCNEAPEALLARAFAEWVELKEDLEDFVAIDKARKESEAEGWVTHEQVLEDLRKRDQPKKRVRAKVQS